jgi:hypothetical protein
MRVEGDDGTQMDDMDAEISRLKQELEEALAGWDDVLESNRRMRRQGDEEAIIRRNLQSRIQELEKGIYAIEQVFINEESPSKTLEIVQALLSQETGGEGIRPLPRTDSSGPIDGYFNRETGEYLTQEQTGGDDER